jgi:hypothetical protein
MEHPQCFVAIVQSQGNCTDRCVEALLRGEDPVVGNGKILAKTREPGLHINKPNALIVQRGSGGFSSLKVGCPQFRGAKVARGANGCRFIHGDSLLSIFGRRGIVQRAGGIKIILCSLQAFFKGMNAGAGVVRVGLGAANGCAGRGNRRIALRDSFAKLKYESFLLVQRHGDFTFMISGVGKRFLRVPLFDLSVAKTPVGVVQIAVESDAISVVFKHHDFVAMAGRGNAKIDVDGKSTRRGLAGESEDRSKRGGGRQSKSR